MAVGLITPEIDEHLSELPRRRLALPTPPKDSARPLFLDLGEHRRRHAEASLLKLGHRLIEIGEPGLFSFVEHGKRACNLQPSANCLLASRLLIDKQHIGMHLGCERDCLALSEVKVRLDKAALGPKNFHPLGRFAAPVLDWFRRQWVLQFFQHGRWNQNSRVKLLEEVDLPDQNEVVDRRGVCDDNCRERVQC